jgi:hypothetical protein
MRRKVAAILSMLHEPSGGSAVRQFRGEPVLSWTLRRLNDASGIDDAVILCWDDQTIEATAAGAKVVSAGPRQFIAGIETISAARRWSDGWRGGLLGTCEFDRGFHGTRMSQIALEKDADTVLLVDPAAGLVDPKLIELLIERMGSDADLDLCFSQVAPGLSGVLLRVDYLDRLAAAGSHPGTLLCYHPDSPRHDPIGDPASVVVPLKLARTARRFTLDSNRQIRAIESATAHLNGELLGTDAMGLFEAMEAAGDQSEFPREIVLELNTERATDPIDSPGNRLSIQRSPMELATARKLFDQFIEMDDTRLVLAGVGDPLLHDGCLEIIAEARAAGINAISIETDFVGVPAERIIALAESAVDLVSVRLPAATAEMYRTMMGGDHYAEVLSQIKRFVTARAAHGRGVPLLAPTFVKCRQNLAEMEAWYDQWLRAVGCAVICGPSDFGGLIADISVADMSGPCRKACVSLSKRLMILSNGSIVSCEQDVLGRQVMGSDVRTAWKNVMEMRTQSWESQSVCKACKQWNRA